MTENVLEVEESVQLNVNVLSCVLALFILVAKVSLMFKFHKLVYAFSDFFS